MTIEKRIDIYVFICMKEFPLISVVTVSYNAIATIEQTNLVGNKSKIFCYRIHYY